MALQLRSKPAINLSLRPKKAGVTQPPLCVCQEECEPIWDEDLTQSIDIQSMQKTTSITDDMVASDGNTIVLRSLRK